VVTLLRLPVETKGLVLIEETADGADENLYLLHKETAAVYAATANSSTPTSASRYGDDDMGIFLK
jgi:hypothetical protein